MTDLEERLSQVLATRSADAPSAAGLLRAAESRHLRRRRAQRGVTAVVVMAVLVPLGLLGYGATRGPSQPEPLGPYKYGQHQKISEAVPAAQAPGFRTLDYGVPSHSPELPLANGGTQGPTQEYFDIDARGRLTTMRLHGPAPTATYRLVPGPGRPARPISDPVGGAQWWPMFTSDGGLLWSVDQSRGLHSPRWITGIDGSDPKLIDPPKTDVPANANADAPYRGNAWIDGGRVWFSAVTKADGPTDNQTQWVSLYSYDPDSYDPDSYDPARPQQVRREAPTDASAIDVAAGEAVWIDEGDSKVFAENLASQEVRQVSVPLDDGCRLVPPADVTAPSSEGIVTNGSLIAITEFCPDASTSRVVVTDLSGRVVTDVDAGRGKPDLQRSHERPDHGVRRPARTGQRSRRRSHDVPGRPRLR